MHSTLPTPILHGRSALDAAFSRAVVALAGVAELELKGNDAFEERERTILAVANEACRRLLAADLQRVADACPEEVVVEDVEYRRHEAGTVAYHSLCGDVAVHRHTYRRVGVRNGPTIVPMELEAGLIDGATPALAFSVAHGIAEMPSRRYEQVLRAAHRQPPSRSTIERLSKKIGGAMKQDALLLEPLVRADEELPEGAHGISIGLDRTTVPMAEERPPTEEPSSPRRQRRTKPHVRRPPHPFDVRYRMVYVGTVAVVDEHGEVLVTRKYGATPEEGPDDLVDRIMADVVSLRRQRALPVVVVQDGAAELWGLMWKALRAAGIKWRQAIDRFHVAQHIAAALEAVERDEEIRRERLDYWLHRLDKSDRTVHRFVKWLAPYWDKRGWKDAVPHFSYLETWSSNGSTRYRSLRRAGLPIASGVTEGACKSLIAARFKRSGQRWQQDGLTATLTLRAMLQSDRLDRIWPFFRRRFEPEVRFIG